MNTKHTFRLFKYIFGSFFIMLIYASAMGSGLLKEYQLLTPLLIEEYFIIMLSLIIYDLLKAIIKRSRQG
jgi:hypothetical protein